MSNAIKTILLAVLTLFCLNLAIAGEAQLKPFVLASKGPGNLANALNVTKAALIANGFVIAGSYSPYPTATILVVTNDELKLNAGQSKHGGFGAAQRVAITNVNNEIQVSYTNPVYMANAYRMKSDLGNIYKTLEKSLGKIEEFGGNGATVESLRKYHFMPGMEHYDEYSYLTSYASHEEAMAAVEAGLAAKVDGVSGVYRIDVTGKDESVFGVAMGGKPGSTQVAADVSPGKDRQFGTMITTALDADQYIMNKIDYKDIKSTANLPYEILVSGKAIITLHPRFRIPLNFPAMSLLGSHSFVTIFKCPKAITNSLLNVVSAKK